LAPVKPPRYPLNLPKIREDTAPIAGAIKQRQFENGCSIAFTSTILNSFHSTENCD
jgi:hypothetical protein